MKLQLKPGDKLLCIDANFTYGRSKSIDNYALSMITSFPKLLEIYTVRSAPKHRSSILVCEINNSVLINANGKKMEEVHWHNWRFVLLNSNIGTIKKSSKKKLQLDLFEQSN
jgi:hypothetical protein